jgi:chromosome segregation ATPase
MQAEANNRAHIKIQHQLKLHSENLKYRIEELERSKSELKKKYKSLQEQLNQMKLTDSAASTTTNVDRKDKEIKRLTGEIDNYKSILSSYEQQNAKITDLEVKLRNTNIKHEKEIKSLEDKFKEEISYLNKIITKYEEVFKTKNISITSKQLNGGGFTHREKESNTQRDKEKKFKGYIEEEEEISSSNV